jgi:hypothetical protein
MFVRVESAHDESTRHGASALTRLKERGRVRRGGAGSYQHNNGLHPTAKSVNVIRQLEGLIRCVRGG